MTKKELWTFLGNNDLVKHGLAGKQCICCNQYKDYVVNLGTNFKKVFICEKCFIKGEEE